MASLNCTSKAENEWETLERVEGKGEVSERQRDATAVAVKCLHVSLLAPNVS